MDSYGTGGGNVAGILGLGWSSHSYVNQLGPIAQAKFSYCLQTTHNNNHTHNTYLRFDISIAGSRLTIPANYFRRRSGRGGTIINTGTAYTFLVRPAYEMLERALVNYFSRMPSVFRIHRQRFFNLCYQRTTTRGGFNNLPTITFHLSKADLVVQPQGAFYLGDTFRREYFCLALVPKNDDSVIGMHISKQISIVPEIHEFVLHSHSDGGSNPNIVL
ncbi:hypothetical protein Pyn_37068 [Prunus yedoensis var. nudiflora]|uniref:Xylanase inhibitor C-terminal domain-containing protein n=1 Tax=Prunus yedoensis var. nudiflora TaxID=2094558 RepID=A0A314YCI5_PRUYE|nr:hypothetical protein Pyn_37068 [Prunus yedoensis var. nudiflora]